MYFFRRLFRLASIRIMWWFSYMSVNLFVRFFIFLIFYENTLIQEISKKLLDRLFEDIRSSIFSNKNGHYAINSQFFDIKKIVDITIVCAFTVCLFTLLRNKSSVFNYTGVIFLSENGHFSTSDFFTSSFQIYRIRC